MALASGTRLGSYEVVAPIGAGDTSTEDMSNSPTLSMAATMQGVILGTAAYLSPKQAREKFYCARAIARVHFDLPARALGLRSRPIFLQTDSGAGAAKNCPIMPLQLRRSCYRSRDSIHPPARAWPRT